MGVVFAVLAILAVAIKGIGLLDREPAPATPSGTPATPPSSSAPAKQEGITGEQVAAIAVALALSDTSRTPMPAPASSAGSTAGSWLQSGRIRALSSSPSGARERRK